MARKKWTAEEKTRIVMEVLTTSAPLSEICSRYNVQPSMVYKWKQDFIDGGSRALAGKVASGREKQLERENRKLKEIVADLTLANEIFKKVGAGR
ncbi:MAG: transposase [Nitrososphaerales archaeon]